MKPTTTLLDGEVHLYCLSLMLEAKELSHLEGLLSANETDRAGYLQNDMARKRYIASRGVLREILGDYLGVRPEKVPIATGEHGKPYHADRMKKICFNMSHSGNVLLLALSGSFEVGVDVELIEKDRPLHNMARLAFSHNEQQELLSLPPLMQSAAFYRCWVRKEACLKACGSGFSLPVNSFDVSLLDESASTQVIRCRQSDWHVMDLKVPHGYQAALAVEATGSALSFSVPVLMKHPLSCII